MAEAADPSDPSAPAAVPELRSDANRAIVAIIGFSFALGIGTLALPLVALDAGYDPVTIGLLTATSAISQFVFRLRLPWLLARVPDRSLIATSSVMMAVSYLLLVVTTVLPVFVIAQLLQGAGRALFWTSSQTHAVRTPGTPVRMLARVGVIGNLGSMFGPAVTGLVATRSLEAALGIGIASGVIGALAALTLTRLEPYTRRARHGESRLWRRTGVDVACWSGFTGGGWRALVNSYVPVVLTTAGLAPGMIGIMQASADGAATVAIATMSRLPIERIRTALDVSVVVCGVSLAAVPLLVGEPLLAGVALLISGAASGPLTILGAAVARQLVEPSDEGEAIALVGTFRAGALLIVPTAVAASLAVLSVGPALSLAGLAMAVPGTVLTIRNRL